MKTIGLIGGMGWESSKLYYETINKRVQKVLGGAHSAKIIMVSVDFQEIKSLTFAQDWEAIGVIMVKSALQLEKAGADMIVLCTNLIHLVSNKIIKNTNIPFIHIADATGETIQKKSIKKVLLLGTKDTMEKDFYKTILHNQYDLEVLVPTSSKQQIIHDIIYNELLKGQFTNVSKQTILTIIKETQTLGIEGVILGCTELNILITEDDVTFPIFDTGKIHGYKAVEIATSMIQKHI